MNACEVCVVIGVVVVVLAMAPAAYSLYAIIKKEKNR